MIPDMPFNEKRFNEWSGALRDHFEAVADASLVTTRDSLKGILEPMRYSALGGGKRVRALLVYAVGQLTKAEGASLDLIAEAVEFVHAYSLIHDDLPCMDNDTLRRGKPTCHVKYGFANAMLAGDALQPEAFLRLTALKINPEQVVEILRELSYASGLHGMCGGQYIDLSHVGRKLTLEELRQMHLLKTGALIKASIRMGALSGVKAIYEDIGEALDRFAEALGLGFQVVDDILDVTSSAEVLGKTVGKDAAQDKPTYVSLLGLEQAQSLANETLTKAIEALKAIAAKGSVNPEGIEHLTDMTYYIFGRKN